METQPSLWQRLLSDTPLFFKKAQLFGLGLAGLGTSLTQVAAIPSKVTAVLLSVGTTIAVVAQFAVKQSDPLTSETNDAAK